MDKEQKLQKLLDRPNALKDSKNYDEIITISTQIIELAEEDDIKSAAFNNRGLAYDNKGEYDRAIADFNQAIKLDPEYAEAFYNRGIACSDKDEYDRAIEDYDQAIELDPKYAEVFNNRGFAYDNKGEYDLAIKDYDQAIKLNPEFAGAFYNRGVAYRKKSDETQALENFKKANELDPTIIVTERVKETKEAINFQAILEDLEGGFEDIKNEWFLRSCRMVSITVGIIIIIIILSLIFDIPNEINTYPLYIFLFAITAVVIRQYTNTKQLYIEARNRMAMKKILAHIKNRQTDKKQEFLSKIIDAIAYSTRKQQSSGELPSILELTKKWLLNISISQDFSDVPAGRFQSDGEYTGERFRKEWLVPALQKADKAHPVIVDINGVEGYGSSFLEEAFGGLVRKGIYTKEELDEILKIEADKVFAIYRNIILQYIKMAKKP